MSNLKIALAVTGRKGALAIDAVSAKLPLTHVFTHPRQDDEALYTEQILGICSHRNVSVSIERSLPMALLATFDIVFFVGWQYLIHNADNCVILHDSILPRYRGFAPTATALIAGETQLGVTAFLPVDEVDAGPVLGNRCFPVTYPMKLQDALDAQAAASAELILEIVERVSSRPAHSIHTWSTPQDHSIATYSIWRNLDDHTLDWSRSAIDLARFIDAVGTPYAGARSWLDTQEVVIHDAEIMPDLKFEMRDAGKIWQLTERGPVVVCGSGMLRLTKVTTPSGEALPITRLKQRFQSKGIR